MNFIEIEPKTPLMLHIYKESKQLNIQIQLERHLDDTTAVITLNYQGNQVLNFNGVTIDLEYGLQQAAPYMWKNVRLSVIPIVKVLPSVYRYLYFLD